MTTSSEVLQTPINSVKTNLEQPVSPEELIVNNFPDESKAKGRNSDKIMGGLQTESSTMQCTFGCDLHQPSEAESQSSENKIRELITGSFSDDDDNKLEESK